MDFYEMALSQGGSRWDAELPENEETETEEDEVSVEDFDDDEY